MRDRRIGGREKKRIWKRVRKKREKRGGDKFGVSSTI